MCKLVNIILCTYITTGVLNIKYISVIQRRALVTS